MLGDLIELVMIHMAVETLAQITLAPLVAREVREV